MANDETIPRIEEIVLYNGSLVELNSRNPEEQYDFAAEPSFIYGPFVTDGSPSRGHDLFLKGARKELIQQERDGLVNAVLSISYTSGYGGSYSTEMISGTPIVRVKPSD